MNLFIERLLRTALYEQIPEDEVVSRQQFMLYRIFSFAGALVCVGVVAKMLMTIKNPGIVPFFILALAIVILCNFYALKKVKDLQRAYLIMLSSSMILLHTVSYTCGGIRTGGTLYFSTVILYAFMLLGRKGGLWFSALSVLHFVYLYFISLYTDWTSFSLFKDDITLISQDFLVNAILSTYLIATQGNYLQSGKNIVIQRLEKSKKLLEETNHQLEEKNNLLNEYALNLEKTNKELEKFASVASHDLKAPLRAIGNLTGIIEYEAGDLFNDEIKASFNTIKGRVNRMEQLLNALLEYSKADRLREEHVSINLNHMVDDLLPSLTEGILVSVRKNSLPTIVCAPKKMQRVISNLIINAIMFNDKEHIEITISGEDHYDQYLISVKDNGPGINRRYHEKIFIIFQTLNQRDELESMGVGLPIAKKIIEDFGGNIWVESEEGSGSDFRFTIPKKAFKRFGKFSAQLSKAQKLPVN